MMGVGDEGGVLGKLSRVLSREGYEVARATSGQEAWKKIATRRPDLVILDVMMPGVDGLALCKQLRADNRFIDLPVLFLTARDNTEDVVAGLDAGGDDYVLKPFELAELTTRVRALLRRNQREEDRNPILELGPIQLDSDTYRVSIGGELVQLTATEHRLLRFLMEHPNQAMSPSRLLEAVWDYPANTGDPDLVRAHVRNLRVKLERGQEDVEHIKTIHGVAYIIPSLRLYIYLPFHLLTFSPYP